MSSLSPQQFNIHNQPHGSTIDVNGHKVSYEEFQPNGDNGKPARGYVQATYRIESPEGHVSYHDTSPWRKTSRDGSQRAYTARLVAAQTRGGNKAPRSNRSLDN